MIPNSVHKQLKLIKWKHQFRFTVTEQEYDYYKAWTGKDLRECNSRPEQESR